MNGSARPLEIGHWAAHRVETLTHHHLRQGEPVAIDITLDKVAARLSGATE
jgi:3-dehydroquinate synthase